MSKIVTNYVTTILTYSGLGELRDTRAPAAYIEIGRLDSQSGREKMVNNREQIAKSLAKAVNYYLSGK